MRAGQAIALVLAVGLLAGSGGAARASSHGPTPHASTTISVWFKRSGRLWHTKRTVSTATPRVKTTVRALFDGPNAAESAAGVKSAVLAGTRLFSTSPSGHVVTVNVGNKFVAPAPKKRIRMRLAQLTYTATQFPDIHAVHLENQGNDVRMIHGVPVPAQMTRAMFARLLPAIVVSTPAIGTHPASPIHVTGTSDVFEAAMVVKVLDSAGHRIARKSFTASCGTGCRGRFTVMISYQVATAQNGTLVVTDTSARGGRPPNIVRIPLRLSP